MARRPVLASPLAAVPGGRPRSRLRPAAPSRGPVPRSGPVAGSGGRSGTSSVVPAVGL